MEPLFFQGRFACAHEHLFLIGPSDFIADSFRLGALTPVTSAVLRAIMLCFDFVHRHIRKNER
jgi:hypothetical protein